MRLEFRFAAFTPLFLFDKTYFHISVSLPKIGSVPSHSLAAWIFVGLNRTEDFGFQPFLYRLPQSLSERWQLTFFRGGRQAKGSVGNGANPEMIPGGSTTFSSCSSEFSIFDHGPSKI